MIIRPLQDRILVKRLESEEKTASGIIIPDNAKEKPKTAKVVAVGPEAKQVKVGDRIIYKSYSTTDVKIGSEEFILVKEEDVLATVNGK